MSLLALFVAVDDFCIAYEAYVTSLQLKAQTGQQPGPKPRLSLSEVMTIIIHFHQSGYRDFKDYYQKVVFKHLQPDFPNSASCNQFVELMPEAFLLLCLYMQSLLGRETGIAFLDSTRLVVCHDKPTQRHKVFAEVAARGVSSMGWFYGFKLHPLRKNMQNRLMPIMDKILLRKRSLIETINAQLKNQIDHSRHRSLNNFMVNLVAALIAYSLQPKKLSLNLSHKQVALFPALI